MINQKHTILFLLKRVCASSLFIWFTNSHAHTSKSYPSILDGFSASQRINSDKMSQFVSVGSVAKTWMCKVFSALLSLPGRKKNNHSYYRCNINTIYYIRYKSPACWIRSPNAYFWSSCCSNIMLVTLCYMLSFGVFASIAEQIVVSCEKQRRIGKFCFSKAAVLQI